MSKLGNSDTCPRQVAEAQLFLTLSLSVVLRSEGRPARLLFAMFTLHPWYTRKCASNTEIQITYSDRT
jgi:hypothetical protein